MNVETLKVRLNFLEEILGSSPNKEIMAEHLQGKCPTQANAEQELASLPEELERQTTVFPKDENGLFIWDYQVRGMFKELLKILCELGDITTITKFGASRVVDNQIFIRERKIYFKRNGEYVKKADGVCERSLRAVTMQGERISIARSESLNTDVKVEFTIELLKSSNPKAKTVSIGDIEECLNYGLRKGFSQWRNSGKGRFEWEKV